MSTKTIPLRDDIGGFKPPEAVTFLKNAGVFEGETGTVVALDLVHGWRLWVHPDTGMPSLALHMDPDDLEHVAPKPEWKPGTTGTATVRGIPNIRVMRLDGVTQPWVSATFFAPAGDVKGEGQNRHDDWQVVDFVPDGPRPLPTREQLANAVWLTSRADEGTISATGADKIADAILALLRGESR